MLTLNRTHVWQLSLLIALVIGVHLMMLFGFTPHIYNAVVQKLAKNLLMPSARNTSFRSYVVNEGFFGQLFPKRQDDSAVPHIVHSVWMANPLKPYTLSSIDSVFHFMPTVTYKLHILTPAGCNDTVLASIQKMFERQLEIFLIDERFDLRIILHTDIASELIGTPLEGKNITQEHLGGSTKFIFTKKRRANDRLGSPHGDRTNSMVHASDVFRLICLHKEGGIYMDTDHIVLRDMLPFVQLVGTFFLCEERKDAHPEGLGKLLNGFMAASPGHPFIEAALHRVSYLIDNHSVNGLFPIRPKQVGEPKHVWWTAVGPNLLTVVKQQWLLEKKDVWVAAADLSGNLTLDTIRTRPLQLGYNLNASSSSSSDNSTSITIVGRRYFIPTSWKEVTLSEPLSAEYLQMYNDAYSFHLWEIGNTSGNKIRPRFAEYIKERPKSVLAYLFKRVCSLLCDVNQISKPVESLQDIMLLDERPHA